MATFDVAVVIGDRHFDRGAEVPDDLAEAILNPKLVRTKSEPADDSKGPSKADLEAEIAKRNEGRDEADLIKPEGKGNKPDLVAALAADDARAQA